MKRHGMAGAVICSVVVLVSCSAQAQVAVARPVRMAVIDCSAQQFTLEGMSQARADAGRFGLVVALLKDMGLEANDISPEAQMGQILLADTDLLIIRKLTVNTRTSLKNNAAALGEFVAGGGTVVQVTATDQEQQVVDWLPKPLGAMITDLDFSGVYIEDPDHPLFTTPNLLSAAEMEQITQQVGAPAAAAGAPGGAAPAPTSPVSWESFQGFRHAKLLVTNRQPGARAPEVPAAGLLEFAHGKGRILLMSLRPCGAYASPGTDLTRDVVTWFVDNIVDYARTVRAGQAPPVEPQTVFPW